MPKEKTLMDAALRKAAIHFGRADIALDDHEEGYKGSFKLINEHVLSYERLKELCRNLAKMEDG
jgi:hypothetical protein